MTSRPKIVCRSLSPPLGFFVAIWYVLIISYDYAEYRYHHMVEERKVTSTRASIARLLFCILYSDRNGIDYKSCVTRRSILCVNRD